MEVVGDGVKDVLPSPHSAQNKVYEYGGSSYNVLGCQQSRIIFSDKDGSVNILTPGEGTVERIVGEKHLRYADFDGHPSEDWCLAVQEDHEQDTPSQVKDYIVAIHYRRKEVLRIISGADFYYLPQFSPDGKKMCWLEWDNPSLPFSDAVLFIADLHVTADGMQLSNRTLIAGGRKQGVAEPRWGLDGTLFFGQEVGPYRRPFRLWPGSTKGKEIMLTPGLDAEFGEISLFPCRQGARFHF
jgi:hypothetical protein